MASSALFKIGWHFFFLFSAWFFQLLRSLARNLTTYTSKSVISFGEGAFKKKEQNSEWNVSAPRSKLESSVSRAFPVLGATESSLVIFQHITLAVGSILYDSVCARQFLILLPRSTTLNSPARSQLITALLYHNLLSSCLVAQSVWQQRANSEVVSSNPGRPKI